jgi:MoxR-like ATPase
MSNVSQEIVSQIHDESSRWKQLQEEVSKVIVGQQKIIERACIGLLCNGHILLEGVPGLAKTTLVKTFAQALGLNFSRIQFTPDLLPSDLLGTLIYNQKTGEFITRKGPVFTNVLLADEINRSPAKVQSALLESMQEHQVTIGDTTYPIEKPFLVLATQNPIDQEGTYHLPEAQVDRFLFKLQLTYPSHAEEQEVVIRSSQSKPVEVSRVLDAQHIAIASSLVNQIYVDEKVLEYIVSIVQATRNPKDYKCSGVASLIAYGASPRATLALHQAAKAHAFLKNRHFVIPEDIHDVAFDVMRHRIILSYEAEADNISSDSVIEQILDAIPTP